MGLFSSLASGGYSLAVGQALPLWWLLLLWSWALGHVGLSSCSMWAQELQPVGSRSHSVAAMHGLGCPMACGIFLDQRLNPMSPALAEGFFTTEPPGAQCKFINFIFS